MFWTERAIESTVHGSMPFFFFPPPTFLFIFAPYFPAVSLIAENGSEQMALSLGVYIYLCVYSRTSSVYSWLFREKQAKEKEENQTNVPFINQFRADVSEKFLSPFRFFTSFFFGDLNYSKLGAIHLCVCVCVFFTSAFTKWRGHNSGEDWKINSAKLSGSQCWP